jgi:hypothetical protein
VCAADTPHVLEDDYFMANPKHLEIARQGKDTWNYWRGTNPNVRVDFSDTDFTLPKNNNISLSGFEFGHMAIFTGVKFGDGAKFDGVSFGDETSFDGATFGNVTNFTGTIFGNETTFTNATFGNHANFTGARFGNYVRFVGTRFSDEVCFINAVFNVKATFADANFGNRARFDEATFGKWVNFEGAVFGDETNFRRTVFDDGASFAYTIFGGWVYFDGATFMGKADFERTRFDRPPNFNDANGCEYLSIVDTQFRIRRDIFQWTEDSRVVSNLRHLRGVAEKIHAIDAERDLFILERMAERGVLWKNWWDGNWKSRLLGWWRPASATVLMFFYWALSNCGRSIFWPLAWLGIANYGASFVYGWLVPKATREQLWTLTLAGALPFGEVNKTALGKVAENLFADGVIPPTVQALAIGQGVVNALLVFLLALALRNHFKVK